MKPARTRAEIEAQGYEGEFWQLTETLTRVLQESQNLANRQLSCESVDSVWRDFIVTVTGTAFAPTRTDVVVSGMLERRRLPRSAVIQVSTRQGDRRESLTR